MSTNDPESYGDYSVDDENQLNPDDTLGDPDVDELDRGYSPPEKYSAGQRYGNTPWEAQHHEPLADRLADEVPEPDPYVETDDLDEAEAPKEHEVGGERAGRLVDPDQGTAEDTDDELIGQDVGIDGAAASAEEAAMHVIPDDEEEGPQ